MKAVVCQNAELNIVDLPDPVPGPGQVLVAVERCGICGSDLHMRHHCDHMKDLLGRVGAGKVIPASTDAVVFGHEFCCEVLDFGSGCDRKVKTGTRVVGQPMLRVGSDIHIAGLSPVVTGGYAERMLLQESALVPVPNGLSSDMAALTEPMAVAWHAVRRSEIAKKDVAIVIGCGPVGLAVICVLKAQGVATVVASDFSPGRRALAERCGADIVIDPKEGSPYAERPNEEFIRDLPALLELSIGTREKLSSCRCHGMWPGAWWKNWVPQHPSGR